MRARKAGFTLVEVMIALALFGIVIGTAYEFMLRSTRNHEILDIAAQVERTAREHMSRLAQELRQSSTVCPDWNIATTSDAITFNKCLGSDGDDVYWSPTITYSLTAAVPGESFNGGDDNQNTLVDEGLLTRTEDTAAVVDPSLNYVPGVASIAYEGLILPGGLSFVLDTQSVTVTVTVSGWHSATQSVLSATQQTIVALRN